MKTLATFVRRADGATLGDFAAMLGIITAIGLLACAAHKEATFADAMNVLTPPSASSDFHHTELVANGKPSGILLSEVPEK